MTLTDAELDMVEQGYLARGGPGSSDVPRLINEIRAERARAAAAEQRAKDAERELPILRHHLSDMTDSKLEWFKKSQELQERADAAEAEVKWLRILIESSQSASTSLLAAKDAEITRLRDVLKRATETDCFADEMDQDAELTEMVLADYYGSDLAKEILAVLSAEPPKPGAAPSSLEKQERELADHDKLLAAKDAEITRLKAADSEIANVIDAKDAEIDRLRRCLKDIHWKWNHSTDDIGVAIAAALGRAAETGR
jgi:peptidoglycan hydrolase CwlO-like protein